MQALLRLIHLTEGHWKESTNVSPVNLFSLVLLEKQDW
jgi:hypothetical protein